MTQGCSNPELVPDPDNASAEQINDERLSVANWGACYKGKFDDWVTWYRAISKSR